MSLFLWWWNFRQLHLQQELGHPSPSDPLKRYEYPSISLLLLNYFCTLCSTFNKSEMKSSQQQQQHWNNDSNSVELSYRIDRKKWKKNRVSIFDGSTAPILHDYYSKIEKTFTNDDVIKNSPRKTDVLEVYCFLLLFLKVY